MSAFWLWDSCFPRPPLQGPQGFFLGVLFRGLGFPEGPLVFLLVFSIYLEFLCEFFAIFGRRFPSVFGLPIRAGSLSRIAAIGVRSSEASGSLFPGSTNQRLAPVGVAPLLRPTSFPRRWYFFGL